MSKEIQKLEEQIMELTEKLTKLRKKNKPTPVKNYSFETATGKTTLRDLFGSKKILFAIHNMGQGCRYCTMWADGLNGFLPHLEDQFAVALLSKDDPETQRRFANSRGWRFTMASHGGGTYLKEQTVGDADNINCPGLVCYIREGDKIFRKNSTVFGPGDLYCPHWHVLSTAGIATDEWTAQYNYWQRPKKLDDGGDGAL